MIATPIKSGQKECLDLSPSAHLNGCETPGKPSKKSSSSSVSSSNETNNGETTTTTTMDEANQLTSANSISSNETVIAHPSERPDAVTATELSKMITNVCPADRTDSNSSGSAPSLASAEAAAAARSRTNKTLKSLFVQFASQHLNLFHHNSSGEHNNNNSNNSNLTPTKQRACHQNAKRCPSSQLIPDALLDAGAQPVDRKTSSNSTGNNFLVSFAQKCLHLNFSSSSAAAAAASSQAASVAPDRNCHSCPVTPIKQQLSASREPAIRDGKQPNGCSGGPPEGECRLNGTTRLKSLFGGNGGLHEADSTRSPATNQLHKKPQVRFVVESSQFEDGGRNSTASCDTEQNGTCASSEKKQLDGGGKQRYGYFMINKHLMRTSKQQTRAKQNDCASQTNTAQSLLSGQNEFIEDDEARAKLVELLFKLPEMGAGGKTPTSFGDETPDGGAKQQADDHQCRTTISNRQPMNSAQFRDYGYLLIDYICNYLDTIRQRRVTPINIEPGYLKSLIKPSAPERGEPFSAIMHDFENHIMCGITHWQHPHFHAYFPAGNAYPSILADMLSDALGCVGFSWAASPAYTELEIIMLDWMGKMIGLPDEFLCLASSTEPSASPTNQAPNSSSHSTSTSNIQTDTSQSETSQTAASRGGGVIQGSASECVLVSMLAARHWAMDKLRKKYPNTPDGILLSKLIGYCSKEAHSCVEKAAMIGFIRMRTLETDEKYSLRGETLRKAIELDLQQGLEPFIVCATLGTTSCVSFDNLRELGEVCRHHDSLWLHVDAAYAGSALICPEFKYLIDGIELATSINMNPNKWMLINFDCSLMWVKDRFKLTRAFVVDPLYLQHSFSDQAIDYRHWGIPLSRRFRALKLWFVIRSYGVEGLREYIRNHVRLAKLFESLIREDKRFMITNEVTLGLVCFRLIGSNALNQRLLSMLNASGKLHMVPASLNGRYIIRFCVCDQNAKAQDIHYAYECISQMATELFELIKAGKERIRAISQQNTIDVSSISLHTQQSASADRLSGGGQDQAAAGNQQVGLPSGARPLLRRSSTRRRTTERSATTAAAPNPGDSGELDEASTVPVRPDSRSPRLMKQASVRAGMAAIEAGSVRPVSTLSNGEQRPVDLEDLEQEVPIDSLATIDGCDFDLDDELDEVLFDELQANERDLLGGGGGGGGGMSTGIAATGEEDDNYHDNDDVNDEQQQQRRNERQQLMSILNDSISPIQRGRLSRACNSARSSSSRVPAGGSMAAAEDADEAADELVKLVNKRNRMSLRYKREFFVRVVSDPRVYRASISGDINAHTSSTSSLASPAAVSAQNSQRGQQQQQQQSGESSTGRIVAALAPPAQDRQQDPPGGDSDVSRAGTEQQPTG